jgi:MFS transporter, AAHS family, 4-hydroxybenzoate transporter
MTQDPLPLKLKNLIDNNPMSIYQTIIVAICFILNMNDGIDVLVEWGLSKAEMGYVFSAGLAGMTAGCFFIAPLADKIGRRKVFLIALVLITSGMLLVGICAAYWQLLVLRLITGLGIGGILPTMAATASEFSNSKNRDFNVGLVQAGWPVGAIFTGFFCAYAIPLFGWRFAFLFAGCISLSMLVGVWFYMTDSIEYLVKQQPPQALDKINDLLGKMGHSNIDHLPSKAEKEAETPIKALFSSEYKISTLMLWTAIFFGFFTLYTLMSWMPNIAKEAGLPFEMATYVGIVLNTGSAIGTAIVGVIAGRLGLRKSILFFMIGAIVVLMTYGSISLNTILIFVLSFLIGLSVQGGFNGIYPVLSRVYPAEIRTTGVGFAVGVGRFGAVLGPTVFGMLSDMGMGITFLFALLCVPLAIFAWMVNGIPSKNV